MRVAASLRERMNKQAEEIKRERGEKKKGRGGSGRLASDSGRTQ